ncbi:DUF4291 family protein [Streptomyces sp. NPDC002309]
MIQFFPRPAASPRSRGRGRWCRVASVRSLEVILIGLIITGCQAWAPETGLPAAREGRFPAVWQRDHMTWIKASFLRMMRRRTGGAADRAAAPVACAGQRTVRAACSMMRVTASG